MRRRHGDPAARSRRERRAERMLVYAAGVPWEWPVAALVAFLLALVTTPAGVSGAVLLLPIQLSVLHVPSPAVTPTNLLFNVAAVPGGLLRFWHERRILNPLTWMLVAGTLPGVIAGAVIRVELLSGGRAFTLVAAGVLLPLGLWLAAGQPAAATGPAGTDRRARRAIWLLALVVGMRRRDLRHRRRVAARAGPARRRVLRLRGRASDTRRHISDLDRGDRHLRDPAASHGGDDRAGLGAWPVARRWRVRGQLPRRAAAEPNPGSLNPAPARTDRVPRSSPLPPDRRPVVPRPASRAHATTR